MTLAVNLAPRHPRGLRLANPVLTASGTCGYGVELKVWILPRVGYSNTYQV